jgi:hypothetical protein
MSQAPAKKRPLLSYRLRVVLFLIGIAVLVVLTLLYAPHEPDSSNVTGDAIPSTVTVTNPLGSLAVNRGADFQSAYITVTQVMQASSFSDDTKRGGNYVVRVELSAQNKSNPQNPIDIDYPSLARLQLAGGQTIAPKLISISPIILPRATVSGYIDFAIASPQQLSGMALILGGSVSLAFS